MIDSSSAGVLHERVWLIDVWTATQQTADAFVGQRVEAQDLYSVVSRHCLEVDAIVGAEPVCLAARQAESWTTERFKPCPYGVQGCASVRRTRPFLVKPVDEQGRVAPLGW